MDTGHSRRVKWPLIMAEGLPLLIRAEVTGRGGSHHTSAPTNIRPVDWCFFESRSGENPPAGLENNQGTRHITGFQGRISTSPFRQLEKTGQDKKDGNERGARNSLQGNTLTKQTAG